MKDREVVRSKVTGRFAKKSSLTHRPDILRKEVVGNPTIVHEIPDFDKMTRSEEADWWESHDLAPELWEHGPEVEAEIGAALWGQSKKQSREHRRQENA